MKKATLITWGWSVIVIAATWLFTPFFAHLITGISDPEIVGTVEKYMKINTAFYFILGIVIVFRNALQGVGDKITPIAFGQVRSGNDTRPTHGIFRHHDKRTPCVGRHGSNARHRLCRK